MELLKVTRDIAIRVILFNGCEVPKVGASSSEFSQEDLLWAEQLFSKDELKEFGRPIWTFSMDGVGFGEWDWDDREYGHGYGKGYGYTDEQGAGLGYGEGYGIGDPKYHCDSDGDGYGNFYSYGTGDRNGSAWGSQDGVDKIEKIKSIQ